MGQSSAAGSSCNGTSKLCARAEVVTNEYCHLTFEKDLHGSMHGVYTGDEVQARGFGGRNGDDDDDDNNYSGAENTGGAGGGNGKKSKSNNKKTTSGSGKKSKDNVDGDKDSSANPKISTITQRKRGGAGGSSGKSKRGSSSSVKRPRTK